MAFTRSSLALLALLLLPVAAPAGSDTPAAPATPETPLPPAPPPAVAENAPATNAAPEKVEAPKLTPEEYAKAWPFPVGEEIEYTLYWGVVPVGTATITTSWVQHAGKKVLRVHSRVRSNAVIRQVYPVEDDIESIIDPATFLPLEYIANMRQGRHRRDERTVYDHKNRKAHWESFRKQTKKTYDIDADTRDMICFLYFMRGKPLEEFSKLKFRVDADEKVYDLEVNTYKTESIDTSNYGELNGLKCIPKAEFQGLVVRKGDMTVWVSRDPRAVMLKMIVDTPFANVEIGLEKVRGPGTDFWVEKKD